MLKDLKGPNPDLTKDPLYKEVIKYHIRPKIRKATKKDLEELGIKIPEDETSNIQKDQN